MISFASIDRIEGKFAVCEVELIIASDSKPEDFATKDTAMMDVSLERFPVFMGKPQEGDIFLVEHDSKNVTNVYCRCEEEKKKRLEILGGIKVWW